VLTLHGKRLKPMRKGEMAEQSYGLSDLNKNNADGAGVD